MTIKPDVEPTGLDLIQKWIGNPDWHRRAGVCPACSKDVTRIGLTSLACVFDVCSCGAPEYAHLVEQLWHLKCLRVSQK